MSEQSEQDSQERKLWRRYVAGAPGRPEPPALDPNDLAAYLDGTGGQEVVERVEAAMAADPALLEEVVELRGLAGAPAKPVPPSVLRTAKALVGAEAAEERPAPAVVIRAGGWWRRLQWAAAAAVVVVSCLGGYTFGRETLRAQVRAETVAESAPDGLEELISGPDMSVGGNADGDQEGRS